MIASSAKVSSGSWPRQKAIKLKFKAKLTGFDGLSETLRELPTRVENKVLQKSVTAAARSVRKEFQNAAPRDEEGQSPASELYGRGYRNIRVQRLKRTEKGQKGARITTGNAFWLYFYELGTRYQPARPWFLPTFQRLQKAILSELAKRIGEGIEKESKK